METDVVESPSPAPEPAPAVVAALGAVPLEEPPAGTEAEAEVDTPPLQNKRAQWTPERRAALSEKMKHRHQGKQPAPLTPSPFALTDDHEFPTSPAKPPVTVEQTVPHSSTVTLGLGIPGPPPALPGTALSPFRRCSCLGVLPGRVCTFCYGTKWTKLCSRCEGEGRIHLTVRKGAERSQPCGHCGGRGILPAHQKEITEATRAAEEFAASAAGTASPNGHSLDVPGSSPSSAPEFRRAVKLPGIGVTNKKRIGTLLARKRESERNETRKQKRRAGRQALGG